MLPVSLRPVAGFCIKTSTVQPSLYTPLSLKQSSGIQDTSIPIPDGYKIFVNVAWDANVPPPPEGNEEAIQRAMNGDEMYTANPDDWFVPIIVSEGRFDTDKAGKASLVFDCVFHNSVKSRTLRDPEFKVFIIELAIQRIEAQSHLVLSRQIGMPNIAAKGKLQPRTVSIPSVLAHSEANAAGIRSPESKSKSTKELIFEEITSQESFESSPKFDLDVQKPKLILKRPAQVSTEANELTWSWYRTEDDRLQIQIKVPPVDKFAISRSNLDIEPRRLIFSVPNYSVLDLDLSLSDAELVAHFRQGSTNITEPAKSSEGQEDSAIAKLLALKRQRPFNVESATAEWFIADNKLLISV